MEAFWAFSWVLIPIAAMGLAGFKEWLKFKHKQDALRTSTDELEEHIVELHRLLKESTDERDAIVGRLENLEAIVATQAWDALHDQPEPPALDAAEAPLLTLPTPPSDAERAAYLARRVRE